MCAQERKSRLTVRRTARPFSVCLCCLLPLDPLYARAPDPRQDWNMAKRIQTPYSLSRARETKHQVFVFPFSHKHWPQKQAQRPLPTIIKPTNIHQKRFFFSNFFSLAAA